MSRVGSPRVMRERLRVGVWLTVAGLALAGCAHRSAPGASDTTAVRAAKEAPAAATQPIEALIAWLPKDAVLVGRVDVVALDELGLAEPLLAQWVGSDRAASLLDGAQHALLALSPVGEGDSATARVVVVRQGQAPSATTDPGTTWNAIAAGVWLGCIERCEGFAAASVAVAGAVAGAGDLRASLPQRQADELVALQAAIPRDASSEALRARLIDTPVSVLSDLDDASLRIRKRGDQMSAELSARFGSAGVASNAGLLLRGALGDAADQLERIGLEQEAKQLMGLHLELKSAMTSDGVQEKAELYAELSLPVLSLPALALAWSAAQRADAEDGAAVAVEDETAEDETAEEAPPPAPAPEVIAQRLKAARAERGYRRVVDAIIPIAGEDLELKRSAESKAAWLVVRVPKAERLRLRAALATALGSLGMSVVLLERGSSVAPVTPAVLGVFRARDALDVLKRLGTGGARSGVLRRGLADFRREVAFELLEAKADYVAVELKQAPGPPAVESVLAAWVSLCPGTSVDAQRAQLLSDRRLDCFLQ